MMCRPSKWTLRPLLYELSLSLPTHAAFRDAAQPVLERLARRLHAVAFLYLRRVANSCVSRVPA
jgi:DNA-binding IclR family transcriptional regulator